MASALPGGPYTLRFGDAGGCHVAELRPDQQYCVGAHGAGAFNVNVNGVSVGVGATTVARPRRRRAG